MNLRFACLVFTVLALPRPAAAQQRPLITEDPEPIGVGRVLVEGGIDYAHAQEYPVSGLSGNLWRIPTLGVSVGLSSIAELQIDGALHDRRPAQQQTRCPQCLPRPAVEAELVAVLDDQTVAEAKARLYVVVHVATGLAEGVVRQPAGAARVPSRLVID